MTEPGFVHLRVRSVYSLLEGALPIDALAKLALEDGQPALAICDNGNLFGALEFCTKLSQCGVQPIIGMMLAVDMEFRQPKDHFGRQVEKSYPSIALFAQNEEGYRNLIKLSSHSFLDINPADIPHVSLDLLESHSSGLIALTGGATGPIDSILQAGGSALERAMARMRCLQSIYEDRLYVEVQRHGLGQERMNEPILLDLAYETGTALVASNDVFFQSSDDFEAQQALFCISEGKLLSEEVVRLSPEHSFKSRAEMVEVFRDLPEATANSVEIAKRCSFWLEPSKPTLPKFLKNGENEDDALATLAQKGLQDRINQNGVTQGYTEEVYHERLSFEIGVIQRMRYSGYFLIVADFIAWAKSQSISVGPGRGSGAGSLVAWSLGITELDPIRFQLLFERFLNPERVSMPDFDIDFCQDRRDEVIKYVQDRYGVEHVAQIITFGTLQARAVLRDVGRVLEMRYGDVDALCRLVPQNPANPVTLAMAVEEEPRLRQARDSDSLVERLLRISLRLEGLYRHASTHAAGIVISERALQEIVPLYRDPHASMLVTQFNMKWVEQAGLVKFDFLGLKTLTVIEKTLSLLRRSGVFLNVNQIPLDDKKTYELLSSGETIGIFQVESAGMRDALKRMRPDRLEDIIALVALYRPGPMDNISTYCHCKHGKEVPDYLHPKLEPILRETYGVIIYQEQVMQIAQVLSGYSLGKADLLRRAMGKKIKEEMNLQRATFIEGAVANGIESEVAKRIFDLVAKFANYGFNKSHAAAYALISYQTAYLKANHPVEFLSALMTCDMNNTDKLRDFCYESKRLGIPVLPPSINESSVEFIPQGGAICYALSAIKTLGQPVVQHLVDVRESGGAFKDLLDFAQRIDARIVKRRALESMASVGVFDSLGQERECIIENARNILAVASGKALSLEEGQSDFFESSRSLDLLQVTSITPWSPMERLSKESELMGFFLSGHPLDEYLLPLSRLNPAIQSYASFAEGIAKGIIAGRLVGIVVECQERRSKSGNRYASVTLSDPTGQYEAVVFSDVFLEQGGALKQGRSVVVTVDADKRDTEARLRIQKIELLEDVEKLLPRMSMQVTIEPGVQFEKLKTLFNQDAKQGGQIHIVMCLDQGRYHVKIKLPGFYKVDSELVAKVKGLRNILSACLV